MVQLLIDHGADVNTPGRSNETPLAMAEARGLADVAAVLRRAGARVRLPGDVSVIDPPFRLEIERRIRALSLPVQLQFHDQPVETRAAEIEKRLNYSLPPHISRDQAAKIRSEIHELVLRNM
jgi:ankyrin repeat protein